MSTFPVDDVTLDLLEAALTPDEGRTHLQELLSFGSEWAEPYEHVDTMDGVGMQVGGWHHNHVIAALVAEVRRLRGPRDV